MFSAGSLLYLTVKYSCKPLVISVLTMILSASLTDPCVIAEVFIFIFDINAYGVASVLQNLFQLMFREQAVIILEQ